MPTITPFLWFDSQAEEAMNFYKSIFERTKVLSVSRAQGRVMSVTFELEGQKFMALNAGPHHTFNEAVSFFVGCDTQEEIDRLWDKLRRTAGHPADAAGSRTGSGCRGRSSRTRSDRCCPTATPPRRSERWTPCCR